MNIPKLRFPGFSGNWEEHSFAELLKIKLSNGATISKKAFKLTSSQKILIQIDDIFSSELNLNLNNPQFLDGTVKEKTLQAQDIIINRVSIKPSGVGKLVIVAEIPDRIELIYESNMFRLRFDDTFACARFIAYFGTTDTYMRQKMAFARIGNQASLSQSDISSFIVHIPRLDEQQKIAGFLTVVDERVAATQQKVELLKQYKKGVMQKIFTQQIRFKDENGQDYPEWQKKKLGELVSEIADGGTPNTAIKEYFGGDVNWVVIDDIQDEIWTTKTSITEKGLRSSSAKLWPSETLILSTGATIGEVGIAKVPLATKQGIVGITTDSALLKTTFLRYWLQSNKQTLLRFAQGSSIKEIRAPELRKLHFMTPDTEEQKKIADFLTSLDDKIRLEETKLEQAKQFKKSLLQRMFV